MIKSKNFGAAAKLKPENLSELKINGIKHPNIFNSKLSIFNSEKRYGFTLGENTEIVSEDVSLSPHAGSKIASADVNLSPLRGKHPPEAGERGLMKRGFTLAEVLITLVVIGVAAAITIPVLHSNTQGKEWNAAKQKVRAGLGEAFKLMTIDGPLPEYPNGAADVVKQVLPKYIKIAKTCNTAKECGFADTMKTCDGGTFKSTDLESQGTWIGEVYSLDVVTGTRTAIVLPGNDADKAGFFQTLDGFSIALFYNPFCTAGEYVGARSSYTAACFNAVYDMNGKKGPNQVGKDIGFAGSFNYGVEAHSAAVLPVDAAKSVKKYDEAVTYCKSLNADYDLPSIEELSLIYLNRKAFASKFTMGYSWVWSRSGKGVCKGCHLPLAFSDGVWAPHGSNYDFGTVCVRADKLM